MPRPANRSFVKTLAVCACLVLAGFQLAACSSRAERAKNYYDHGMAYLKKQDYVKARIEIRNALQLNRDMLEGWQALAKIDEHSKNWSELAGSLRRIVDLDKKDAKARIQLAKLYLLGGSLDQALQLTNAAVDLEPRDAGVLALKAAVLFKLKDTEGATREAKNALKIDPGNPDANVVLATQKLVNGDLSGALQSLANISSDHTKDLGVMMLKLSIYDRMKKPQEVEALLRQLVSLHPKQNTFRTGLIRFYLAQKRPADAEKELRTFVTANPEDVSAELELVNLLSSIKGPDAAEAELTARIKAGGKVFPYQVALARLEFIRGKTEQSKELLTKLGNSSDKSDALIAKVTLAQLYMTKNDVAAAEPLIADVLKSDDGNPAALQLRANIRLNRGKVDDAISDLRRALNEQPRSPQLLASLGLAYERNGAIDLADKSLLDATRNSNFAPTFGLNYVKFLERRGRSDQVSNILETIAAHNPTNIAVLSELAKSRLAHQDWVGAQKIADAIHRLNEKSPISDQIKGAALLGQKKLSDSLAVLKSAYEQNPGIAPMATLVNVYMRAGQSDKAEAFLQAALKANPHNAEALVLLGGVHAAKKDTKQAEIDFASAIKQQPKDAVGYRALATLYAGQNKLDEAVKVVRDGLHQQPKNFALQLTLAGLFERKRDYDSAIAQYESMLKDQPDSMVVANNLASLLSDHRTDKASLDKARSLAVLLKASPIPQFKDTVGWIEYQQGDYKSAVASLEDAAAKLPNTAMIRYHLGMSYMAAGDTAKASEEFKKARALSPNDTQLKAKIDSALAGKQDKGKS